MKPELIEDTNDERQRAPRARLDEALRLLDALSDEDVRAVGRRGDELLAQRDRQRKDTALADAAAILAKAGWASKTSPAAAHAGAPKRSLPTKAGGSTSTRRTNRWSGTPKARNPPGFRRSKRKGKRRSRWPVPEDSHADLSWHVERIVWVGPQVMSANGLELHAVVAEDQYGKFHAGTQYGPNGGALPELGPEEYWRMETYADKGEAIGAAKADVAEALRQSGERARTETLLEQATTSKAPHRKLPAAARPRSRDR